MTLFWLLWVTLVLGGVAGVLWANRQALGLGLRPVRVLAQTRRPLPRTGSGDRRPTPVRGSPLPLPRVTSRSGPLFRPPA
jgi:hypothetical protein